MTVQWDPAVYTRFGSERMRPGLDLMARIPPSHTARSDRGRAVDLGCGTGDLTRALAERLPNWDITGLDSSPEMLAKAEAGGGRINWVCRDVQDWSDAAGVDVIYSNACLHWVGSHAQVVPDLVRQLRPGGVLAVQMPANFAEPSHQLLAELAATGPWRLRPTVRTDPVAPPSAYWRWLAPLCRELDIWTTAYLHVLDGDDPVLKWIEGTWLRPVLAALGPEERDDFRARYAAMLRDAYPAEADGKTLFPFRRLFIVAVTAAA